MKAIERLYEYLDYKKLKPTALEKEIGLSNGYISVQKKRNADMGEGALNKIIDYCRDINPLWLLTGEGNMLRADKGEIKKEGDIPVARPASSPMEGIPLIPVSAMAGVFAGEQTVLEYECERFVIPTFKGAEFLISVKGSSMYPKYNSGDIVACKRLPMSDIFFQWNKAYVLDTDQRPAYQTHKARIGQGTRPHRVGQRAVRAFRAAAGQNPPRGTGHRSDTAGVTALNHI